MKLKNRIFFFFITPAEIWIRLCGWLFNVDVKTEMDER